MKTRRSGRSGTEFFAVGLGCIGMSRDKETMPNVASGDSYQVTGRSLPRLQPAGA